MILYQHIFTVFLDTPTWGDYICFISWLHLIWSFISYTIQVGRFLFYTEVENQFIKWFKGLKTDWWGKYTSGILIETNVMSMELFTAVLCHILHGWMEEYNYSLFPWLCEKALHTTICWVSHYLSQSLFIFCELEGSILFIFW